MRHVNLNSRYRLGLSMALDCPTCKAHRFHYYLRSVKIRTAQADMLVSATVFECSGCGAVNTVVAGQSMVCRSQPLLMLAEALEELRNGR